MSINSDLFSRRFAPGWLLMGICLGLVGVVWIVFGQCRSFDFVNYDDRIFVTKNEHVLQGLSWENAQWSLMAGSGKTDADIDYWRPLSMMSHMLDVELFGLNAGAHHVMSVGLHALAAVTLFLVLLSMTGLMWRSAFIAAVFAVHPLHVESVAWVAERKDVLSGLFFFLTIGAYTRYTRRPFHLGNYLLTTFIFVLGLMSKPMLVTVPCVLMLLDWWPLQRIGTIPLKWLCVEKIPWLIISVLVSLQTAQGPGGSAEEMMAELPFLWRTGNAFDSWGAYLTQTFWPTGLACFYPHPEMSLSLVNIACSVLVIAVVTLGVLMRWRDRYLAVGWFWFLGMLVPVSGLLQSGLQARADRYTYITMIGLSLMVTWVVVDLTKRWKYRRLILGSGAGLVLIFMMVTSHAQAAHWRDSVSLWTHTLSVTKDNANAYNYFGLALEQQKRSAEAIDNYREALRFKPDYAEAHCNLGIALFRDGNVDESLVHLHKAVEFAPSVAAFHFNLGNALLQTGKSDEAADCFEKTLLLDSLYYTANNNLGLIRYQQGMREEAIQHYMRVVELIPRSAAAHRNLATVLLSIGRISEAMDHHESAISYEPDDAVGISAFAWLLATCPNDSVRNGQRAVELAQRAARLAADKIPTVLHTLAVAYAEAGQFDDALTEIDRAFELAVTLKEERLVEFIRQTRPIIFHRQPVRDASLKTAP
jgi:tetratricopeptide (TPR) repeat protein